VDAALTRNMKQLFRAGLFDPPSDVSWTSIAVDAINSTEHQRINLEAAQQSAVLLRNDDSVLPLKPGMKIAVVGPQGIAKGGLLSDYASEQPCADGSQNCITSIAEAVAAANGASSLTASTGGVDINSNNTGNIAAALALVQAADVVLLCLGNDKSQEGEGTDRPEITLPGLQVSFAKSVLALGKVSSSRF